MEKIKLHSIERKILLNAFKNGLDSNFSEEEAKILQRLKQRGVIKGKRFAVNYNALGFKQGFLFASIEHSGLDFPKFMEEVLALKNVSGVYFLTGEYDIAVSIFAKKLQSINNIALEIEQMFSDYIERTNPIFVFKTYKQEFVELHNNMHSNETINLDEISRQLLLQKIAKPNAKIKEIAEAIGIHRNTAGKKWKFLKERIVLKTAPLVDFEAGLNFNSFIFFDILPGKKESIAKKLASLNQIKNLHLVSSQHDLLALVSVANLEEFFHFHRMLFTHKRFFPFINKTRSFVILNKAEKEIINELLKIKKGERLQ